MRQRNRLASLRSDVLLMAGTTVLVLAVQRLFLPEKIDERMSDSAAVADARALEPGRGRLAAAPSQLTRIGWKDILFRVYKESNEDRILSVAAGMTFYSLLALFPGIAAFVALYGLFADTATLDKQISALFFVLPGGAAGIIVDEIKRVTAASNGSLSIKAVFGFLLALYSANAGMKATFDGLNVAYEEREKRSFVLLNAQSVLFTVLGLAAAIAALTITVITPVLLKYVYLGNVTETLITWLRWPLAALFMILVLSVLYRFGASRDKPKWRWVTWGSTIAAVLWMGVSSAFSWYVAGIGNYDRTYGALGTIIGFMTWIWLSSTIILLGAELNAEMEHQTALDTTSGPPMPLGLRGAKMADTIGQASH